MKIRMLTFVAAACFTLGCGPDEKKKSNNGSNNGGTNNGASNNGVLNNGTNNGTNNGVNNGSNNGGPCPGEQQQASVNGELGCYDECDAGACPAQQTCRSGLCIPDDVNNPVNNGTNNATNNATTGGSNNGTFGSCDEGGYTACFSNGDCQASERCENVAPDGAAEVACCVMGSRGAGTTGDMCSSENDCESGLCVARNDDPAICSQECDLDNPCPGDLECQGALGLCVTPDQG